MIHIDRREQTDAWPGQAQRGRELDQVVVGVQSVVSPVDRRIDHPVPLTEAATERSAGDRPHRICEPPQMQREAAAGLGPVVKFGLDREHARQPTQGRGTVRITCAPRVNLILPVPRLTVKSGNARAVRVP